VVHLLKMAVLIMLLGILVVVLGLQITKFWAKQKLMPPGPLGIPLLGYLPWLDPVEPYKTMAGLVNKYGKVLSLNMGSVPCVVVADNGVMKDLFSREEVTGRAPLYLTHGIMKGKGLICSEGEHWKEQRKWAGLTMRKLGLAGSGIEAALKNTLEELMDLFEEVEEEHTNPLKIMSHVVGNMLNEVIFGMRYSRESQMWKWLQLVREEGIKMIGVCGLVNFLPVLRFWPSIARNIKYVKDGQKKTHKEYEKLIQDRETYLRDGNEPVCLTDYFLVEASSRESIGSFTRSQLYYLQADLFGAGIDTSLNTVLWALLFLSSDQFRDIQEKIQEEIDNDCHGNPPSLTNSLPLLRATVFEVQRLRPVTPLGIPHGTISTTNVGPWTLPAGTMVLPLHWAINRDPELWENPEEFCPHRFLDENGVLVENTNLYPFQVGKRRCIGEDLGKALTLLTLANILSKFSITLEKTVDIWHTPVHGFTLAPQDFRVKLEQRKQ